MYSNLKIKKGELWEFHNPNGYPVERHALVYITRATCRSNERDTYEYLEILGDDVDHPVLREGYLTIRHEEYGRHWTRLA